MNKTKLNELKELEKLQKKLARKKAKLEEQMQADAETAKWYDQVLQESGFKRPRDFMKALMEHFGIRTVSLQKAKRGPGRPPKATKAAASENGAKSTRKKRTKVTPQLRDQVKQAIKAGTPKTAIGKKFSISYPLIKKIGDGGYDKL